MLGAAIGGVHPEARALWRGHPATVTEEIGRMSPPDGGALAPTTRTPAGRLNSGIPSPAETDKALKRRLEAMGVEIGQRRHAPSGSMETVLRLPREAHAAALAEIEAALEPARRETAVEALVYLRAACPPQHRPDDEAQLQLALLADLLEGYPADAVHEACIRRSWKFFPGKHDLKQALDAAVARRRVLRGLIARGWVERPTAAA